MKDFEIGEILEKYLLLQGGLVRVSRRCQSRQKPCRILVQGKMSGHEALNCMVALSIDRKELGGTGNAEAVGLG
jgi:hypothetical protein